LDIAEPIQPTKASEMQLCSGGGNKSVGRGRRESNNNSEAKNEVAKDVKIEVTERIR